MEKMTFDGLENELFTQSPFWQDFIEALADFYQEQVREPLDNLREIRNITEKTDPNVVLLTLRDLGIDVPLDLIVNPERLLKSVYMIPLVYQHTGLDSAWRVIEFILGRRISVQPLWTEDYIDFYPEPYGPLRVDGGTWYKTTHVNLSMQLVGTDSKIVLPRNQTLKDRLLSAFYSFAPVNLVIDKFYFSIDIETERSALSAVVVKHPRRIIRFEDRNDNYSIVGPGEVNEGDVISFYLKENGHVYYPTEWWTNKPGIVQIDNSGNAAFSAVDFDTDVIISTRFLGQVVTKIVTIKNSFADIRFIEIEGPDEIIAGEYADYTVRIYHQHGNEIIPVNITLLSPYASIAFNRVTALDVTEDQVLALHAIHSISGVNYTAAKLVKLKHVDAQLSLIDFYTVGMPELQEEDSYQFQAIAVYSDNSFREVLALWESSSSSAHVDSNGTVTTGRVEGDTDLTLTATYTFRGITKTHSKNYVIRPNENPLVSIYIDGPTSVTENARTQFNCFGVLADGTVHTIEAKWSCADFYIGQNGILEVGVTGDRPRTLGIYAEANSLRASFAVNIGKDPIVLNSLEIQGPENLYEGNSGTYYAFAVFSDGTKQPIMPTWSIVDNPEWASIDSNGIASFISPEVGLLEIHAEYFKDGVQYTQTKTVVCTPKTNIITGLLISGPDIVDAGERIVLTATAVYQDGTTNQVNPKWSVSTADSNADFIAADIVGSGVVQGRLVDEDMEVIVTARYFQEEVNYKVTVRYVQVLGPDIPESSRISGPPVFYANQVASYAQLIKFKDALNELAVSSDWYLDVDEDIAAIDQNGFLTVNGNRAVTMTITAVYKCGGYTVTNSIVVSSIVMDSKYSTMFLYGPDSMEIGETAQLTSEIFTLEDTVSAGNGTFVSSEWEIVSDALNLQISNGGLLRIIGPVVEQSFTVKASYSDSFETIEATKTISVTGSQPIYGAAGINADNAALFGLPNYLQNGRIDITVEEGEYGYFVYPLVWGLATFTEVDTGIEGGWDGATWPADGSVGSTAGPLTISRTINGISTRWYVYRTNFANIGTVSYDVTFS